MPLLRLIGPLDGCVDLLGDLLRPGLRRGIDQLEVLNAMCSVVAGELRDGVEDIVGVAC